MTNFSEIYEYSELSLIETQRQIERLKLNPKWPEADTKQRESRLPLQAAAVEIVRFVATNAHIAGLVAQQMGVESQAETLTDRSNYQSRG